MDKIVESFIEDFKNDFGFGELEKSKLFEHFINYSLISKIEKDRSIIETINVGGSNNPGIDGLAVIVNDHLVTSEEEVEYFYDILNRLDVEFIFIQSKTSDKFEMSEINNFIFSVKNFFSEANLKFEDQVLNLRDLKDYIYKNSVKMDKSPSLKLYYAACGTWNNDQNISAIIETGKKELKDTGLFNSVTITIIDTDKIKKLYREIKHKITKEIYFEKHTILPKIEGVTESYIGYLPVQEYLKLVTDDDGELLKNVFYDNVRDFQGFNYVNNEIRKSIENKKLNDKFVLLNNGITVVSKSVNKVGTAFKVNDYQIVNGCQTSHVLYYSKDEFSENLQIPIKLIVTDNPDVTNNIIKATNQQTEVKNEAFEILSPFHKKVEEFYLAFEKEDNKRVYYERRSKQYDNSKINRMYIITLSTQISSFIAMFLNEPQSTKRYFGELLRAYKNRLFQEDHSPYPYYTSGLACYILETFYRDRILNPKFRQFKHHMLMLFRIKVAGEKAPPLSSKKIDDYCNKLLTSLWNRQKAKEIFIELEKVLIATYNKTGLLKRQAHVLRSFTEELIPSLKMGKRIGYVTYFNDFRGFGFIRVDGIQDDIFVHASEINRSLQRTSLRNGEKVKFNIVDTYKGPQAKDMELVENEC